MFSSPLTAQKVTVIGIGRLGLCLALALENAGHEVLGVDLSLDYIRQLNDKSFCSQEPEVSERLRLSQHFRATNSLEEGLEFADLYLIAVQTNPSTTIGSYNCELLDQLLKEINTKTVRNKHVVIVSTLLPGYIQKVAIPALHNCPETVISYNPEFIAQGIIMQGLQNPEVVLIGEASPEKGDELIALHKSICQNAPYFARMSPESAEISKLAANCFATMKVSFANLVGDIAEATPNANKDDIIRALGADSSIGSKRLFPGYGFGGPCWPRDNRALGMYAASLGIDPTLFCASDHANSDHAKRMAAQFLQINLPCYVFEDVCYKPNCPVPIIEESQKLAVAKIMAEKGAAVLIKDRHCVIVQVQEKYGDLFEYEILE